MNAGLQHMIGGKAKNLLCVGVLLMLMATVASCGGGGGGATPPTAPSAPAGVTALSADGMIVVGWQASSGAASYNLYMAASQGVTAGNYSTLPNGTRHEGVSSPCTITGLQNGTTYHIVVTAKNSVGESGVSTETSALPVHGNGDVGNYYPMTVGSTWTYSGTFDETGQTQKFYTLTTSITGTTMMNGAVATAFEDIYSGVFDSETYYQVKDSNGVIELGSNDTADVFSQQLDPIWLLKFPLGSAPVNPFVLGDKHGLNLGQDIDDDGIADRVDVYATATLLNSSESVTVDAGIFQCAKWKEDMQMTVHSSRYGTQYPATDSITVWFSSGVGMVKLIETFTFNAAGYSSTDTMQLVSHTVN